MHFPLNHSLLSISILHSVLVQGVFSRTRSKRTPCKYAVYKYRHWCTFVPSQIGETIWMSIIVENLHKKTVSPY
jgi:hypothetical protein